MDKKTKYLFLGIGLIAIIALLFSIFDFKSHLEVPASEITHKVGDAAGTESNYTSLVNTFSGTVGITGTTTVSSKYFSVGNIDYAFVQKQMAAASAVACSIENPFGNAGTATSTLIRALMQITTGTSSTASFFLATSTSGTATTTTLVGTTTIPSTSQETLTWAPSGTNGTFAPNHRLNFAFSGEPGTGGYTYTGTCSALFMRP